MRIDFLYFEDCPSHEQALERLHKVLKEEDVEADISVTEVTTEEQALDVEFLGSPTIRIEDRDIDPVLERPNYALSCRTYHLEDGRISPLPSEAMIRRAVGSPTPSD
ncbi:MAG: DUF2703 domain-containing protein [Rubrobacteraceae bacterium]